MKNINYIYLYLALMSLPAYSQTAPVNPNATRPTINILNYLWDLSYGSTQGVVSGQNVGHGNEAFWGKGEYVEQLANATGKYVGMVGIDYEYVKIFSFSELSQANKVLINYWKSGGLITINYTPRNPLIKNGDTWTIGGSLSQLLPDGDHRSEWLSRLDVIAAALKELSDSGVSVLWRPIQENNGGWFWYGTNGNQKVDDFVALWQDMYDYFTNVKGLNNLLWVYSPAGDLTPFAYPGKDYVDIVGGTDYNRVLSIYGYKLYTSYGKVVGMGEYGWGIGSNNM